MEDASTLIARQYEAWAYPEPFADIRSKLANGYVQIGDPAVYGPALWPEGRPRERLKILVAGCGTVQAAVIAYTNPGCDVFGVDLSEASLAHERFLQDKHRLTNLVLYKGDLRHASEIGNNFDLIFATGVLHHMSNPEEGLAALVPLLAPQGAFVGMVYAATRRSGVYMLQDALRRMGVQQDAAGVAFTRSVLKQLPPGHYVHRYTEAAEELAHDAAIVDTFLNPQDRAYLVPQLLSFVTRGGLAFQNWAEPAWYWPEGTFAVAPDIFARLKTLPDAEQWAAVEMLAASLSTHTFIARTGMVDPSNYRLDFGSQEVFSYIPHRAPGAAKIGDGKYIRGQIAVALQPPEEFAYLAADGQRTLGDILAMPQLAQFPAGERETFGRTFLEHMWKLGLVMVSRGKR